MRAPYLLALACVLCGFASSEARAQRFVKGGWGNPPRPGGMHGHRGFHVPIFLGEREVVVVEREVIREAPPPAPSPKGEGKSEPAPPRKPYAVGSTYASLPGGCMKLIEDGASFYYCSGEWYRQAGKQYRAVREP